MKKKRLWIKMVFDIAALHIRFGHIRIFTYMYMGLRIYSHLSIGALKPW